MQGIHLRFNCSSLSDTFETTTATTADLHLSESIEIQKKNHSETRLQCIWSNTESVNMPRAENSTSFPFGALFHFSRIGQILKIQPGPSFTKLFNHFEKLIKNSIFFQLKNVFRYANRRALQRCLVPASAHTTKAQRISSGYGRTNEPTNEQTRRRIFIFNATAFGQLLCVGRLMMGEAVWSSFPSHRRAAARMQRTFGLGRCSESDPNLGGYRMCGVDLQGSATMVGQSE